MTQCVASGYIWYYNMKPHFRFEPLESSGFNSTAYAGDDSFGPFLELPGRTPFNFTLLFEETILSMVLSAILLILIPPTKNSTSVTQSP